MSPLQAVLPLPLQRLLQVIVSHPLLEKGRHLACMRANEYEDMSFALGAHKAREVMRV
jgi:hypothetical protein